MKLYIDNCYFNRLFDNLEQLKPKMKTGIKIVNPLVFIKDMHPIQDCFVPRNDGISHSSKFLTLNF
jgi:hypothetical protein